MAASRIVLASASPRRRRLIAWLGFDAHTLATDTAEDLTQPLAPPELAASLATEKALAARAEGARGTILAFDTIVVHDGAVLGKPVDADDARRMLRGLSGGIHEVITGVAVCTEAMAHPHTFTVSTPVHMRSLDAPDIEEWIAGGEALGCAGAYNIEHHLASVEDDQCFQNVAGLPLCHVYRELSSGRAGATPVGLVRPVEACDAALGRRCMLGPEVCAGSSPRR
ncbi:MAG: Maf family protein [Coriobacteriia bacterium]|nr:Maf family protein [Coriobacteriia bacterium]MBN2839447.1 Maf family protein [Coriobacteriia bacterium]